MPLYTAAELTEEIAAYKAAVRALATSKRFTVESGGVRREVVREDLPALRAHLEWLQAEADKLVTGSTAVVGRTFAKQGGTGRW